MKSTSFDESVSRVTAILEGGVDVISEELTDVFDFAERDGLETWGC